MVDLKNFIPNNLISFLRWLVDKDPSWMRLIPDSYDDEGHPSSRLGLSAWFAEILACNSWEAIPNEFHEQVRLFKTLFVKNDSRTLTTLRALGRVFECGVKVVKPSNSCCEALAAVNINISFDDYRQPYPLLFVELPSDFREAAKRRFGVEFCHRYVIVSHEDSGHIFKITMTSNKSGDLVTNMLSPSKSYEFIEDALDSEIRTTNIDPETSDLKPYEDAHWDLNTYIGRVAVNTCLMLSHLGSKECPPTQLDQRQVARLKKKVKSKRASKSNLAKAELAAPTTYIAFEQEIEWTRKPASDKSEDSEDTGRTVKPHWKRGHIKMQPCGPGLSQRKQIFVKPYMVKRSLFVGNMDDAKGTYSERG